MKIPTQWIHIGNRKIDYRKFQNIQNQPLFPKPIGGLWASPLHVGSNYYSDWHEFSNRIWGKSKNQEGVVFTFKKNTRFYIIDKQEDLIHLIEKVGMAKNPLPYINSVTIDFEKAKYIYDVIFLTKKGESRTRTPQSNKVYNLYGWDSECCLILNPDIIDKQIAISIS